MSIQRFGDDWTEQKLNDLSRYLNAYVNILSKTQYKFAYIDAFAGTGFRETKGHDSSYGTLFPGFFKDETRKFQDGSAKIALKIKTPFMKYIFIEADAKRCDELRKVITEFPHLADRILIEHADCNKYLQKLCNEKNWAKHRAVLFLDPFGMQVEWETMKAIADVKAIDVFILFPLGMGVNRMLTRDGIITDSWKKKLDSLFGTDSWYNEFYEHQDTYSLFELNNLKMKKKATFQKIAAYYNERLKTIFTKVAENHRVLRNSRNNPLFALYFAAGNPKGAPTAVKIANYILKG